MSALREYPCYVRRVVDGDTLVVDIDLGFNVFITQHVRLAGVNTPELNTAAGREAKRVVEDWTSLVGSLINKKWPFVLVAHSTKDKYGRRVADLRRPNGDLLGPWLLERGYGVPWP